jgi:hypothetical protein
MPRASAARRWLLGAALPLLLLAATLAGCVSIAGGGSQPTPPTASAALTPPPLVIPKVTTSGGDPIYPLADVYYRASIDFYSALQLVTNLGLQTVRNCTGYTDSDVRWQSQDQRYGWRPTKALPGQPLGMAPTEQPTPLPPPTPITQPLNGLEVAPTPLAPSDWLQRLAALPSVVAIYDGYGGCPLIPVDLRPVPGALYFLGEQVWAEDVRVQFAAGAGDAGVGYDAALATISGLGFRLANPCYEQSLPPPLWRPMGQQASFASSGALIVAITAANSTAWLAQLKAAAGVVSVQAPYTQQCATH